MSNLQIFNFESQQVRVQLDEQNQPLFCLVDACKILGLSNSRQTVTRLDESYVTKNDVATKFGVQALWFVGEPNIYRLIFRSNKPEAKKFQDWVFNEVLPKIRKTGSYSCETTEAISIEDWQTLASKIDDVKRFFHRDDREEVEYAFGLYLEKLQNDKTRQLPLARAFHMKIQQIHSEVGYLYADYRRKQIRLISDLVESRPRLCIREPL